MKAEIYWVEGPWPGRLAILARPRGGDWLEDEVRSWRAAGVDVVVSALTEGENAELDLLREAELCAANGIGFETFPISDRGVPRSADGLARLVQDLDEKLARGKTVGVHCRMGVGRSALMAACLLAAAGADVDAAFARIGQARGCGVPDTPEQRAWVARFAREQGKAIAQVRNG